MHQQNRHQMLEHLLASEGVSEAAKRGQHCSDGGGSRCTMEVGEAVLVAAVVVAAQAGAEQELAKT